MYVFIWIYLFREIKCQFKIFKIQTLYIKFSFITFATRSCLINVENQPFNKYVQVYSAVYENEAFNFDVSVFSQAQNIINDPIKAW